MSNSRKTTDVDREDGDRPYHNLLDVICEQWDLESATDCLPALLRPDGEADTWPAELVQRLAQLTFTTRNERTDAVRDLRQTWHVRLSRFPESNPDLLATDVQFVNKRWRLADKALKDNWTQEECLAKIPALDTFSAPPKWKKRKGDFVDHIESREEKRRRKGKGPVRFQSPTPSPTSRSSDLANNPSNQYPSGYVELVMDPTPIPDNLSLAQRIEIYRIRDELCVKDLEYIDMCVKQKLREIVLRWGTKLPYMTDLHRWSPKRHERWLRRYIHGAQGGSKEGLTPRSTRSLPAHHELRPTTRAINHGSRGIRKQIAPPGVKCGSLLQFGKRELLRYIDRHNESTAKSESTSVRLRIESSSKGLPYPSKSSSQDPSASKSRSPSHTGGMSDRSQSPFLEALQQAFHNMPPRDEPALTSTFRIYVDSMRDTSPTLQHDAMQEVLDDIKANWSIANELHDWFDPGIVNLDDWDDAFLRALLQLSAHPGSQVSVVAHNIKRRIERRLTRRSALLGKNAQYMNQADVEEELDALNQQYHATEPIRRHFGIAAVDELVPDHLRPGFHNRMYQDWLDSLIPAFLDLTKYQVTLQDVHNVLERIDDGQHFSTAEDVRRVPILLNQLDRAASLMQRSTQRRGREVAEVVRPSIENRHVERHGNEAFSPLPTPNQPEDHDPLRDGSHSSYTLSEELDQPQYANRVHPDVVSPSPARQPDLGSPVHDVHTPNPEELRESPASGGGVHLPRNLAWVPPTVAGPSVQPNIDLPRTNTPVNPSGLPNRTASRAGLHRVSPYRSGRAGSARPSQRHSNRDEVVARPNNNVGTMYSAEADDLFSFGNMPAIPENLDPDQRAELYDIHYEAVEEKERLHQAAWNKSWVTGTKRRMEYEQALRDFRGE